MCVADAFWLSSSKQFEKNLRVECFWIFFGCWNRDGLLSAPPQPPRNLNKHGGGAQGANSAPLPVSDWLMDVSSIMARLSRAGCRGGPGLANDIPPLPIPFYKQSQLIPNHNHRDLSRISLSLKNDEWDKSNDELRQEEMSQRKRFLLSWAPTATERNRY